MNQERESVNGVIFSPDRTEVLLIKRRDLPVWALPGGGIEQGETPARAAVREVEEETGYRVTLTRKIAEYTPVCRLALVTHVYECAIAGGKPALTDETCGIQFFPLASLPSRLPPPYPDWITDATLVSSTMLRKKITSVTYKALCKHAALHPILVARFLWSRWLSPPS
ncbi:MAG: NUDIX domain-containing protein [Chlamydiota bacterium]